MLRAIFCLAVWLLWGLGGLGAQGGSVIQAEYFWDTDPGQGNGTPLSAADGAFSTAIEEVLATGAALPASTGLHTFHVRIKEQAGTWSNTFSMVIEVQTAVALRNIQVSTAEYFWDSDPGVGNGSLMVAFDGNFNQALEQATATITPPSLGLHTLNIRMLSVDGGWSSTFSTVIEMVANTPLRSIYVQAAEYFWDTDPGEGNGTPLLAFDGNFNQALEQATATITPPSLGLHTLNIRMLSVDGGWSSTFSTVIEMVANTPPRSIYVQTAEYFWDTDPGEGNGTPLLAFDGNFNQALEQAATTALTLPALGLHTLHIRMKSIEGAWSPVFSVVVEVLHNEPLRNIYIQAAEFYWDTDPGQGNGTPMIAFDGNLNQAIEQVKGNNYTIPGTLTAGIHALYTRVRSADGTWSTPFGIVLQIDFSPLPIIAAVNGTTSLCSTGNLNNIAYDVAQSGTDSYSWTVTGGGAIVSGQNTNAIQVNWTSSGTVRIIQCNGFGCDTAVVVVTVVSPSATPTISAGGATTFCIGDDVMLQSTVAPAGYGYQWYQGGTAIGGATNQSYTTTTSGTYSVVFTGSCASTSSNALAVTVNSVPAAPVAGISGSSIICTGGFTTPATLTATTAPVGYGYQWYQGGVLVNGATNSTYNTSQSGSYTVLYTGACPSASSNVVVVTDEPTPGAPVIGTSQATTFCAGNNAILSVGAAPAGYSYQWFLDGSAISGANADSYTATVSGNYTAIYTGTCNSVTSSPMAINVITPPAAGTVSVSGSTTICTGSMGSSTTLTASMAPVGYGYQWYRNGLPISGATNNTYTPTQTGDYSFSFTGTCASALSAAANITFVNTPTTPSILANGATTFCAGSSVELLASGLPNGYNYQWYLDGNAIIGANGSSYFAAASGNYTVRIEGVCNSSFSAAIAVSVTSLAAAPTISSTGLTTICTGSGSVLLSSTAAPVGYSYQWYDGSSPISGETNQTYTATSSGNYSVLLTTTGCATANSNSIPVTIAATPPPPALTPNGSTNLCIGGLVTLAADVAPVGFGYQWMESGSPISGATNQDYTTGTAGVYSVFLTGACPSSASAAITVTVSGSVADPSISTLDNTTQCNGGTVSLAASNAPMGYGYQWYDGTTLLAGATGQSYLAATSGNYQVVLTGACVSAPSNSIAVYITTTPTAPLAVNTGAAMLCPDEIALLEAPTAPAGYGYQWYLNGNAIVGATGQQYIAADAGDYTVVFTGVCSSDPSNVLSIGIYPPADPTLVLNGNTLTCSLSQGTALSYQWFFNGSLLPGETNAAITWANLGAYHALIVDANGCSYLSDTVNTSFTGLPAASPALTVVLAPNPTQGAAWIRISHTAALAPFQWHLYDMLGQLIETRTVAPHTTTTHTEWLDLSALPAAAYTLRLQFQDGQQWSEQIIKTSY